MEIGDRICDRPEVGAREVFSRLVRERPTLLEDLERIVGPLFVDLSETKYGGHASRPDSVELRIVSHEMRPDADFSPDLVSVFVTFEMLLPMPSEPLGHLGSYSVVGRETVEAMATAIDEAREATNVDGLLAFPPFYLGAATRGCVLEWNPKRELTREAREKRLAGLLRALAACDRREQVAALVAEHGWRETTNEVDVDAFAFAIEPMLRGDELIGSLHGAYYDAMSEAIEAGRSPKSIAHPPSLEATQVGSMWELCVTGRGLLSIGPWELRLFVHGEPWPGAPHIMCDGRPGLGVIARVALMRR